MQCAGREEWVYKMHLTNCLVGWTKYVSIHIHRPASCTSFPVGTLVYFIFGMSMTGVLCAIK